MPDKIGVTFPIPKSLMSRFFEKRKTVFIKPATLYKDLREGMKFIFYQSQQDTGYVGEAIIKKITFSADPFSFFEIYGDDLFLTREELANYIEEKKKWTEFNRRTERPRKWFAIKLDSIRKYDTPIKPKRFISVSGQYVMNDLLA